MTRRKFPLMASIAMAILGAQGASAQTGLLISEFMANPSGTDSPFEYVELLAARDIDFSLQPHTVVFATNGAANASGWAAGGGLTYAFMIDAGSVRKGEVVYVGGSSMTVSATPLRGIDTANVGGDGGIGSPSANGVLGNGGVNADGIAVFGIGLADLDAASVPIDAVFFGTQLGAAVVAGGSVGYQLPVNDLYGGGKLGPTSVLLPDPVQGKAIAATGVFHTGNDMFSALRTWAQAAPSAGLSSVSLVPEPSTAALFGAGGLVFGACLWRGRCGRI